MKNKLYRFRTDNVILRFTKGKPELSENKIVIISCHLESLPVNGGDLMLITNATNLLYVECLHLRTQTKTVVSINELMEINV